MKHRMAVLVALAAFGLCTLAMAQTAPDTTKKAEHATPATMEKPMHPKTDKQGKPGEKDETMMQRINGATSLSIFADLLKTAELDKTLEGTGEFTVFAPTDDAFKKIPADQLAALKLDKVKLTQLLKNHIIAGKRVTRIELAMLNDKKVKAESGMELAVSGVKGKWVIAGANLIGVSMHTTNGPIHEIDAVIMPAATTTTEIGKAPATEKTADPNAKKDQTK